MPGRAAGSRAPAAPPFQHPSRARREAAAAAAAAPAPPPGIRARCAAQRCCWRRLEAAAPPSPAPAQSRIWRRPRGLGSAPRDSADPTRGMAASCCCIVATPPARWRRLQRALPRAALNAPRRHIRHAIIARARARGGNAPPSRHRRQAALSRPPSAPRRRRAAKGGRHRGGHRRRLSGRNSASAASPASGARPARRAMAPVAPRTRPCSSSTASPASSSASNSFWKDDASGSESITLPAPVRRAARHRR